MIFNKKRDLLSLILFLISFCIIFGFAINGVDSHHEGIVLKNALDVATGKILYRDSFTQYGCMQVWLNAILLNVFGKKLVVLEISAALFYACSILLIYLFISEFIPQFLGFIFILVYLATLEFYCWEFQPWSNIYANTFALLAVLFFLRWFFCSTGKKKCLNAACCASFIFMAFWTKMPIGVVLYMALGLSLFFCICLFHGGEGRFDKIDLLFFFIVTLVEHIIVIAFFMLNDSWYELKHQVFFNAVDFVKNSQNNSTEDLISFIFIRLFYPGWFPYYNADVYLFLIPVVCISCFVGMIVLRITTRNLNKKNQKLFFICIFALALWSEYYPVPDMRHKTWGGVLMFPCACCILYNFVIYICKVVSSIMCSDRFVKVSRLFPFVFFILAVFSLICCTPLVRKIVILLAEKLVVHRALNRPYWMTLLFSRSVRLGVCFFVASLFSFLVFLVAKKKLLGHENIRCVLSFLMTFLAVGLIYKDIIVNNYKEAVNGISTHKVKYSGAYSSILDGMLMTEEEALFYSNTEAILACIKSVRPEACFYNYTDLNMLSCYEGFVSDGSFYSCYGNSYRVSDIIAKNESVIIVSDKEFDIPGYNKYACVNYNVDDLSIRCAGPLNFYVKNESVFYDNL